MGEVIHVAFGAERMWEQTHAKTVDGLISVGALFGDDEPLMRAKGECVTRLLREIVEEAPSLQFNTELPGDLTAEQTDLVRAAIKHAALRGIQAGMTHSIQALMASIYDLCTSKLSARPS